MDKEGEYMKNGIVRRIIEICTENNVTILNTKFRLKELHKFTGPKEGRYR